MRRRTIVDCVMGERVMYGGEIMTRAEVYRDVIEKGYDRRTADYFAFRPDPIEGDPR